ncbi:MAG: acetate--CoA ligase family protein [Burkholderiaceae bacterium]
MPSTSTRSAPAAWPADDLSALLAPRSVAIVGASNREGNLGGAAARMLRRFGFAGAVWPVHATERSVADFDCFASLRALPATPDVAILAIPAAGLMDAVEQCGTNGIRNAIAWAGGFAEEGAAGRARQDALAEACRRHRIRLCGPNCLGIINTHTGFTGSFTTSLLDMDRLLPGAITMVSQSGGLATASMALAQRAGFGFRYVISCGNEAILSVADFVSAVADDAATRVIAMYVEAIEDGPAFLNALQYARQRDKPVILLKGGSGQAARRAALAHTGRLAGSDSAFEAVIHEAGAIRVHSLEELIDVALLATSLHGRPPAGSPTGLQHSSPRGLPQGTRVAITTFGGGAGVLAVDQCERAGLETPLPSALTAAWLETRLPPIAAIGNPIDLTPQAVNDPKWRGQLAQALSALPRDGNFDSILFLSSAMRNRENELVPVIESLRDQSDVPVVVSWPLASANALEKLCAIGVYAFPENARAARALAALARRRSGHGPTHAPDPLPFDWSACHAGASACVVPEDRVAQILRAAALPVAAGELSLSRDALAGLAARLPFPWAMKGISPAIPHRAAAGLLRLHIADLASAGEAFDVMTGQARSLGVTLDGIYVQQMAPGGKELLFSAFRDRSFGVMITCGAGGNLTELIDDVVVGRAPFDAADAARMIERLRMSRDAKTALSPDALRHAANYLERFSRLAVSAPWPRFTLELNPVKCDASGALAVDGLLIIED